MQVWQREGQPWDSHDQIEKNHRRLAGECDRAIGALLDDLVQMGLLESTLVVWGASLAARQRLNFHRQAPESKSHLVAITTTMASRFGWLVVG